MTKRMILMLLAVLLVLGGVFGYKTFTGIMMKKYMMSGGMPPQTVSTVTAAYEDWQPNVGAVGSIRAINGAELSSELPGIVESIDFESDSDVKKGAPLVHLRAGDDIAKLHSLQATAKLAEITFERDQKQLKAQAVSQAVVDTDIANLANAAAQVQQQQAIVDKKVIRAPFSGHVGIRQVDLGQYLNPGSPIASLQQLDPIYIDFYLPEQNLGQLQVGQKVTAHIENDDADVFEGQVTAINSKVDEATRNVQVRATFKNPSEKLLPGMFANVTVDVGQPQRYLTLPQTAIVYNTYGNMVYLIQHNDNGEDKTKPKLYVKQSVVSVGETRGDQVAVLSGIQEGEEVVTTGQVKLRNDVPVVINNEKQPANDPDPKPHEQ